MTLPVSRAAKWAESYVGIPYREGGRHRTGCDCWGLVCLAGREAFGFAIPALDEVTITSARANPDGAAALARGEDDWRAIWEKSGPNEAVPPGLPIEPGDGMLLRHLGRPVHVGIVAAAPHFLHVHDNESALLERFDVDPWRRRVLGFYRWQGARC